MKSPQEKTLDTYQNNTKTYIENTISSVIGVLKYRIDETLHGLPLDAKILEVGTGGGRDADYIESLGYNVERTDAAEGFIQYNKTLGKSIYTYNALTDELQRTYDLIFANAVLLHFTHEQCKTVLQKWKHSLSPTGKISRCVQQGEGDEKKDNKGLERYFYYRNTEQVENIMKDLGFSKIQVWTDEPTPGRVRIRCIASL